MLPSTTTTAVLGGGLDQSFHYPRGTLAKPHYSTAKSITSSSARMWRSSELTCAQSWPTRRSSFAISSPFKTSLHSFSPSTIHCRRRRHRSDSANHQGSFLHPLSFFHRHWGQCPHLFRGVWVIGFYYALLFWCLFVLFLGYICGFVFTLLF